MIEGLRIKIKRYLVISVSLGLLMNCQLVFTTCNVNPTISVKYSESNSSIIKNNDTQQVVVEKFNEFSLTCKSLRNVEWEYKGQGAPSKVREESSVQVTPEGNKTSFCILSTLSFLPTTTDLDLSGHSGKYICREIHNHTNQENIHVYFPKKEGPTLLNSGKTLKIEAKDLHDITIPCETTDPNVEVVLYKRNKEGSFEIFQQGIDKMIYDPSVGFRIISPAAQTELKDLLGEYKCVATRLTANIRSVNGKRGSMTYIKKHGTEIRRPNKDDFVNFNVVKSKNFHAYPNQNEVYTSSVLNLTCEAEEPVFLKEALPVDNDYMMYPDEEIVETTEKTEQKTHVANYLEMTPVVGSFGEFQCISETDSQVLHTWKYRVINKKREKLSGIRYNKRDKSFTCKTLTGNPGKLSFINCRTPSECRINRLCFEQSENCRGYSSLTKILCDQSNNQCTKITNRLASGIIRCVGEGVDEHLEFTELANSTDIHFDFTKLRVEQTKLIKAKYTDEVHTGDEIKVSFKWGSYFFMEPLKWAFIYTNGSSIDTIPIEETVTSNGFYSVKKATLKIPSDDVEAFAALIPLRESPGFSMSKIPLNVQKLDDNLLRADIDVEATTTNILNDQTEIYDATDASFDETTTNVQDI